MTQIRCRGGGGGGAGGDNGEMPFESFDLGAEDLRIHRASVIPDINREADSAQVPMLAASYSSLSAD